MNTQVVTISSRVPDPVKESYYHLDVFKKSASEHGIEPHFLNEGPWGGLISKPKHLLKYLEREGSKFGIICSLDAWDTLLVSSLDAIVAKFKGIDAPIVFNAERCCFPRTDLAEKHPVALSPYRYLNSGFILGYTEAVIEMLREMNLGSIPDDHVMPDGKKWEPNDQGYFMEWYINHQQKAALDSQAFICQTLHDAGPDEFEQMPGYANRIMSRVTGNFPAVFHGNGNGKTWFEKIMKWRGL